MSHYRSTDTESGLRQRIAAAGIRVHEVVMNGSEYRGEMVGHVPSYAVTLVRDDDRTLTETISTGQDPYEPDTFDVMDTLLCGASLVVNEGIGVTPESEAQVKRFHRFVEGPDRWEAWLHATDRDPGRQDDYDPEPDDDGDGGS